MILAFTSSFEALNCSCPSETHILSFASLSLCLFCGSHITRFSHPGFSLGGSHTSHSGFKHAFCQSLCQQLVSNPWITMGSVNPRASGLWSTSSRMSYVSIQQSDEGSDDLDVEALGFDASDEFDGRTPLDKSIDRIGMGEQSFRL